MNNTTKILFIIDPQNDFIEGGSLAVQGGKEALQKIVDSKILDENWDKIIVTLDSHNVTNLGFTEPKTELAQFLYKKTLLDKWPSHCIKDTPGWEIYKPLQDILLSKKNIIFIEKGRTDDLDAYSFIDEPYTGEKLIESLGKNSNPEFYYTGLAEDYCVKATIDGMLRYFPQEKHTLIKEMTSHINSSYENNNVNIIDTWQKY